MVSLRPIIKNKKGQLLDLIVWLVLGFITILFFAVWVFGFNILTTNLLSIDKPIYSTNVSDIARDTFGKINTAQTSGLHTLAFVIIIMSGVSIMISNMIMKSHPSFFIVYLFIIIVAIMLSVILSNQYESLLQNPTIGATLSDFKAASFLMIYLPLITAIIGIFGAIFLFAGIINDAESGGSIL